MLSALPGGGPVGAALAAGARTGTIELPVWEAGLGLSALSLPDYRGADTRTGYLLPLPYLVYRSPRLNLDHGALTAELFERGRTDLDFSVNLSAPVRTREHGARAGMRRLRPTLELGPQLNTKLWRSASSHAELQFQLPLRYAFVLSSKTRDAGFVLHPRLNLDVPAPFGLTGWNLGLAFGPMFGTARHHEYFHGVPLADATATRPAYRARGGYGGLQGTLAASRRFPRHWVGAFVRIDQMNGAQFRDSPLFRKRTSISAGIGFSWIFAESEARIER